MLYPIGKKHFQLCNSWVALKEKKQIYTYSWRFFLATFSKKASKYALNT